jgi:endonuclease/exonuclease/phosphatase family metal-dependent hydrolase
MDVQSFNDNRELMLAASYAISNADVEVTSIDIKEIEIDVTLTEQRPTLVAKNTINLLNRDYSKPINVVSTNMQNQQGDDAGIKTTLDSLIKTDKHNVFLLQEAIYNKYSHLNLPYMSRCPVAATSIYTYTNSGNVISYQNMGIAGDITPSQLDGLYYKNLGGYQDTPQAYNTVWWKINQTWFISVHLSLNWNNGVPDTAAKQFQEIAEVINKFNIRKFVIGGDFNLTDIQSLADSVGGEIAGTGNTHPADNPDKQIDWFITKGVQVSDWTIHTGLDSYSDHCPISIAVEGY